MLQQAIPYGVLLFVETEVPHIDRHIAEKDRAYTNTHLIPDAIMYVCQ